MRLFFALWPPPSLGERLATLAAERAREFGGRPSRRETLHLTLAFLGDIAPHRLPELLATARTVRLQPGTVVIDKIAAWPSQRLLWAGCGTPAPALERLVADLRGALDRAGFVVDAPGSNFVAHVTLLRKLPPGCVPAAPVALAPLAWPMHGFSLVESLRTHEGARYRTVADFTAVPPAPDAAR